MLAESRLQVIYAIQQALHLSKTAIIEKAIKIYAQTALGKKQSHPLLEFAGILKEKEAGNNWFVLIGNEVMINAGNIINYNYFDQDRLYTGINYEINKKVSLQLQYMHVWQQASNGLTLNSIEVLDLFYSFYNPDQVKTQALKSHTIDALINRTYV